MHQAVADALMAINKAGSAIAYTSYCKEGELYRLPLYFTWTLIDSRVKDVIVLKPQLKLW